jgi:hypothetical protein
VITNICCYLDACAIDEFKIDTTLNGNKAFDWSRKPRLRENTSNLLWAMANFITEDYQPYELELWCLTPLPAIFQLNIVAVSFIGEGNRSTQRKRLTCHKLYHIMLYRVRQPLIRHMP